MLKFFANILLITYLITLLVQGVAGIYFLYRKIYFPGWYKWLHVAGVFMLSLVFFTLLHFFATGDFRYYQVWAHVSEKLPLYYKIAALWEGQEGSFLLWAFIQSCAGLILVFSNSQNLKAASVIFSFLQLFLIVPLVQFPFGGAYLFESTSNVLGISPETLSAQWLLEGGKGLNPLLQSFWMTIHPPCVFTAFAFGSISFSIIVAGILREDYTWFEDGLLWLKVSLLLLSLGILMGAYWAYETLNFGGYWSWDPVENAIYIPWIIGIAAMHSGWAAKKYHKYIGLAAFLGLLYFVSIVYSTFLTRSGILTNTSVHSFVDEGYRNLLIAYLLIVLVAASAILFFKRKQLFFSSESIHLRSREDWLLIMAITLLLASFHVFVNTSIPVLNSILSLFHLNSNLAPATTTLTYSIGQGIFAIGVAGVLVIVEKGKSFRSIVFFVIVSMAVGITIVSRCKTVQLTTIVSIFLIVLSCVIFVLLARKIFRQAREKKLSGSGLSHIGFAFLITGIVLSGKELITSETPAHIYLGYGKDISIGESNYRYDGRFVENESGDLVDVKLLKSTFRADRFLAKDTIEIREELFFPGSVWEIDPKTSWFKITNLSQPESSFSRIYFENQNSYFVSPTIQHSLTKDIYIHVSNFQNPEKINWKKWDELNFSSSLKGSSKDAHITRVQELSSFPGLFLGKNRKAFMIHVALDKDLSLEPLAPIVVVEQGKPPMFLEDINADAGVLAVISQWNDVHNFKVELMRSEKSWITIRCEEKPFINLFWLGGLMMIAGIGVSLQNRHYFPRGNSTNEERSIADTSELLTEKEIV